MEGKGGVGEKGGEERGKKMFEKEEEIGGNKKGEGGEGGGAGEGCGDARGLRSVRTALAVPELVE